MGNTVRQLCICISIQVFPCYRSNRCPGYDIFRNGGVVEWKSKPRAIKKTTVNVKLSRSHLSCKNIFIPFKHMIYGVDDDGYDDGDDGDDYDDGGYDGGYDGGDDGDGDDDDDDDEDDDDDDVGDNHYYDIDNEDNVDDGVEDHSFPNFIVPFTKTEKYERIRH